MIASRSATPRWSNATATLIAWIMPAEGSLHLNTSRGSPDRIQPPQGDRRNDPVRRGVVQGRARATAWLSPGRTAPARRRSFAALTGEVSLEGGELAWEKGARVALHDQRPPATSARPLRDYVLAGTADLVALEAELRGLEAEMAGGAHDPRTMSRYGAAQARLEHAGGYDWRDRAASVVRGLGFSDADLDRPLSTFSGGELTRASLARALASQPDLLLLDEPTNHLDIETLEWLEGMLATIDAARDPRRARPLVPRGGDDGGARARPRPLGLLPRASGTCGGSSRRRGPSTRRERPSGTRRRSPSSSGSSSGSARRTRRRSRRSRSRSRSTGSRRGCRPRRVCPHRRGARSASSS